MNNLKQFGIDMDVLGLYPTGSYYTCPPPVENTDRDYLVLGDMNIIVRFLLEEGWQSCVEDDSQADWYTEEKEYGVKWTVYRKGIYNLMITGDANWYFASVIATEYCRAFNIQDKERRIRIFRFLKYKEPLEEGDLA